jgi:hypothetical protein
MKKIIEKVVMFDKKVADTLRSNIRAALDITASVNNGADPQHDYSYVNSIHTINAAYERAYAKYIFARNFCIGSALGAVLGIVCRVLFKK